MRTVLIMLTIALGLGACAARVADQSTLEEELGLMGLQLGDGNASIPSYRINGWSQVDDRNLVINSGVNNRYLVELRGPCPELAFAFGIGFTTTGINRLDRFGDILLRGPGGRREYCPIQNIYQLIPY